MPAKYPLIVFAMGENNPAIYNQFLNKVASKGYVVVAPLAKPCLKAAVNQRKAIDWVRSNKNYAKLVDWTRKVGIMGDGLGASATYMFASQENLSVGAAVVLHPQLMPYS